MALPARDPVVKKATQVLRAACSGVRPKHDDGGGSFLDSIVSEDVSLAGENMNDSFVTISPESTVPEPSTWAMMLLGFAGLGFSGYRASRRTGMAAA